MKNKRNSFSIFLNILLVICVLFIPWWIGYVINGSVLSGLVYIAYFILGSIVGTLLGTIIMRFIKRK